MQRFSLLLAELMIGTEDCVVRIEEVEGFSLLLAELMIGTDFFGVTETTINNVSVSY